MKNEKVVMKTQIARARLLNRGKVRDIYDAGDNLLIVASDRISAFDVIMDQGIPGKGKVLTQISRFWFEKTADIVANHFVTDQVEEFPEPFCRHPQELRHRAMLVKKAQPLPVECIVRGYLAGSGWKEYARHGTLHKQPLPVGLKESARLPQAVFTPSTKAESGHDENITFEEMCRLVDPAVAGQVREISLRLYERGVEIAARSGIIIADTKFEFGLLNGKLILIDEVLTPDSSRFWPQADYEPGRPQQSYDKQYLRDFLETLDWDKTPPPPALPAEVVENTARKYGEILRILTGVEAQSLMN